MEKITDKIIIFVLVAFFLTAGCGIRDDGRKMTSESGKSAELTAPSFSSMDFHKTDFLPQNYLEEPGLIMGTWLSATRSQKLKVSVDNQINANPECRKYPDDCLSVSFPDSGIEPFGFKAAFGNFLVYGIDVDGDYIKEIVIESVENRNSESKVLRILKFVNNELTEIFRVQLNGVFTYASVPGNLHETVRWKRNYALRSSGKKIDLVLYLDKPDNNIAGISEVNDLLIYQIKKITAGYDNKSSTFAIKNTDMEPVSR